MHWIDPDYLREPSRVVDFLLLNGKGGAYGSVLAGGTEVHFPPHMDHGDGIGAWPGKGIFDTQLGPNRNGRKW